MVNLLKETKNVLKDNGKKLFDIKWVGCGDFKISVKDFMRCANIDYDNSYGSQKVATDLLVVGEDWWLERHEYDGAEWWEFKSMPKEPNEMREVNHILGGMWDTLEELNAPDTKSEDSCLNCKYYFVTVDADKCALGKCIEDEACDLYDSVYER